jgi:tetratricopeptide (TPR) repeat protein
MHLLVLPALMALAAAPEKAAAVVLPPVADAADVPLALVIADRASALLAGPGPYNVVHVKQVASMAQRHGTKVSSFSDPNAARAAAERLGTARFAFGKLTRHGEGWTLAVTASEVGSAKARQATQELPKGAASAVREGSLFIARLVLTLDGAALPDPLPKVQPETSSDAAMAAYAPCFATLIQQPIGIEAPTVLDDAALAAGRAGCQEAVKLDPEFTAAWAALGLGLALSGQDKPAVDALKHVPAAAGFVPMAWIARFWLVTRYESSEGGALVLQRALQENPGFLLGRSYQAELFNAVGRHAEAAKAWQAYLALSPNNPYILTRMAYTLARLGNAAEAVTLTEQAVAFDPDSLEMKLELASRDVDAGKLDQAEAALEPLAARSDATAEVVLRLGFVQLLQGELDKAQATLERAFRAARTPAEWRTRARSKYDLALVALQKGLKDKAHALLVDAVTLGLQPKPATDQERALIALAKPGELVPAHRGTVHEASPFLIEGGDIVPDAKRPPPPKGFQKENP